MQITDFIFEQGLIIVPVLIILGKIIKNTKFIKDKYIPIILLAAGILAAMGILGVSVSSTVQGVLLTGTAVFGNQLVKQLCFKEE